MNYDTDTSWGSFTYNTPTEIYTADAVPTTLTYSGLFGVGLFGMGYFGTNDDFSTVSYSPESATTVSFTAE